MLWCWGDGGDGGDGGSDVLMLMPVLVIYITLCSRQARRTHHLLRRQVIVRLMNMSNMLFFLLWHVELSRSAGGLSCRDILPATNNMCR